MSEQKLAHLGWLPVDPPRRPVLFVNPRSGDGVAARVGLAERARELGVEVVILTPGDSRERLVRAAVESGADALGMAGGDGSLAVVAAAAAAHGLPFICVPAGTRNHFALDLGVDRQDVLGALDAFNDAVERQVDMAEVNGHPFLNNVSLGIYGEAVRRAAYRDAKVRTLVETAETVLAPHGQMPALRLVDDAGQEHDQPAVVLVSNNPYSLSRPPPGTRPTLDSGRLGVIVLDAPGPRPTPAGTGLERTVPRRVCSGAGTCRHRRRGGGARPAAAFQIRSKALRVRISSRHPGVSPSATRQRVTRLPKPRPCPDPIVVPGSNPAEARTALPQPSSGLAVRTSRSDGRSAQRVARRCHHCGCSGSDNGADHHVARVVDAGVNSRMGHRPRQQPDRHGDPRQFAS